jgi:hypothetical protein
MCSQLIWRFLAFITTGIEPIFIVMRIVDSRIPTMGKFYEYFDQLIKKNPNGGVHNNKKTMKTNCWHRK